jgi:isoquinoline 1-oxidoreductase alpha subunit
MALAALVAANPRPDQADLDALPNRCRCGAGPRIVKAVARVARARAAPPAPAPRTPPVPR